MCAVFCVYRRWRLSRAALHEIMQVFTRARGMTSGRAHASDVGNTSSRPCSLLLSFTIALVSESKKWRTTLESPDVLASHNVKFNDGSRIAMPKCARSASRARQNKHLACRAQRSLARRAEHPRSHGTAGAQQVTLVLRRSWPAFAMRSDGE